MRGAEWQPEDGVKDRSIARTVAMAKVAAALVAAFSMIAMTVRTWLKFPEWLTAETIGSRGTGNNKKL